MGIWLELGIFIVILIAALWQLHDVKRALAKTRARKKEQISARPADPDRENP